MPEALKLNKVYDIVKFFRFLLTNNIRTFQGCIICCFLIKHVFQPRGDFKWLRNSVLFTISIIKVSFGDASPTYCNIYLSTDSLILWPHLGKSLHEHRVKASFEKQRVIVCHTEVCVQYIPFCVICSRACQRQNEILILTSWGAQRCIRQKYIDKGHNPKRLSFFCTNGCWYFISHLICHLFNQAPHATEVFLCPTLLTR